MKKKVTLLFNAVLFLAAVLYFNYSPQKAVFESNPEQGFSVYFFDVGQADSALLLSGGEAMLIDAGERGGAPYIIQQLTELGVSRLKYAVATHPHSDHIGGMADVLKQIPADTIWMPDVTHTTKTFENLVDTIDELGIDLVIPSPWDAVSLGGASVTVLSPGGGEYDNLNNYSIVLRAVYGDTSFLFMGDAESPIEEELLDSGTELKSTVLKAGHHGSSTSSTYEFLQAVSPLYAVISCGYNNDYGHPHKEVVKRLDDLGVMSLRTYEEGTIRADSDGKQVTFESLGSDSVTQ